MNPPPPHATAAAPVLSSSTGDGDALVARFAEQTAATPDATALITGGERLSYRELNRRVNGMAQRLMSENIGPGDFIGLGLEHGTDLIISLLGVIRSGAAYVPIDPTYPEERVIRMTSSAGLKRVITTRTLASRFHGAGLILTDDIPPGPDAIPPSRAGADDFIYAIFTSGSTGVPKAATVRRSGFLNLIEWYTGELRLGPGDRTLVISSPSFDLTQKNFLAPLMTGGALVLDTGGNYDISRISSLIRKHGITLLNCTPSAFHPVVDASAGGDHAALSSLRFVVLGGEPVSIPRLRPWLEHPACRAEVVNSYGPTECTDICLFHRLHRGNLGDFPFAPLGREIPHVGVTIRDEAMRCLPDGETGELCISGAGVGDGYLHDPARTAEKFIRGIYRTGDLAKRHPCGTFEFRGRVDHQMKVNGHRIEPGEIEIALSSHPDVREAVVTSGDGRLTAHVKGATSAKALKDHIATLLPAYMIPGEFHFLEDFPLTPNGKIDRLALEKNRPSANPRTTDTSLAGRILSLWSEILGRPLTDPDANFSDLGGTSIHLAIAHVRLREMTGRQLDITDLFAHPSARSLAAFLSPEQQETSAPTARDRALMQRAGFRNFKRPISR